jgi:hypothetical protein
MALALSTPALDARDPFTIEQNHCQERIEKKVQTRATQIMEKVQATCISRRDRPRSNNDMRRSRWHPFCWLLLEMGVQA